MIVRIWRTGLDESRSTEYEEFARQRSAPMFLAQDGCLGVLFTVSEVGRAVVTLWRDRAAAEELERNRLYLVTVAAITEAGFLREPTEIEILDVESGWISGVDSS